MKLTQKLLGFLNRAFSRDPVQFLAMRLRYDGTMTWAVEDAVLTTTVAGGSGGPLVVDLTLYTLAELANHLGAQPGYTVVYQATGEASLVGARTLIGGGNNQDSSNGDHLYAFTSLTWAYLDANAVELKTAREQIYQMLRQMVVPTAENEWLDELGGYYNVPRNNGETDAIYGPRIVYEVIRPRNNNKAIEIAISVATGGLPSKVTDVTENGSMAPLFDGAIDFNGAYHYNASGTRRRNLFDVEYAFDLEGGEDVGPFRARVLELIDKFRSAGTHLRQILLTGSKLSDTVTNSPTDSGAYSSAYTATDTAALPADAALAATAALTLGDGAAIPAEGAEELGTLSSHTYNGVQTFGSGRQLYYDSGVFNLSTAPTLDLDFTSGNLPGSVTFTRSSVATYFDSNGVMQTAAIDQPRFEFDPLTLQIKGLLIEGSRSNLALNSDVIAASTGTLLSANATTSPDGTLTADLIYENTSNSEHYAGDRSISVTAGTTYVWSTFVKAGPGSARKFYLQVAAAAISGVTFDLQAKTIVGSRADHVSSGFQELQDGWFRVWNVFTAASTASAVCRLQLQSGALTIYTGDGASGLHFWGCQLETGSVPSSYIPTTGSAVTRSSDVAVITTMTPWLNRDEGTLSIDAIITGGTTSDQTMGIATLSSGASSDFLSMIIYDDAPLAGTGRGRAVMSGVSTFGAAIDSYAFGTSLKLVAAYKDFDQGVAQNGSLAQTGVLTQPPTFSSAWDRLLIGSYYVAGNRQPIGHIRSVRYWNKRLANEHLQLASA